MRDKTLRITKIIQFFILTGIELALFILCITHPQLMQDIFADRLLLLFAVLVWGLLVFSLFFLFCDFFKLRFFEEENRTLKRTAYMDSLTNFPNRHGLDAIFQTYSVPEDLADMGCLIVLLDNLDAVNQTQGRIAGDTLLQAFSAIFRQAGEHFGVVGRNGSNEFIAIINHCTEPDMERFVNDMMQQITEHNRQSLQIPIQIRYAYVLNNREHLKTFKDLITTAYTRIR